MTGCLPTVLRRGPTGLVLAAAVVLAAPGPATAQTESGELSPELEAIREATERFRDIDVALEAGYLPDPTGTCVMAGHEGRPRQLGGMGVHYFRPDLLRITETSPLVTGTGTHTDFEVPGILVYMPDAEGKMELVAIENLVFREAWHAAGHEGPPEFMGNQYYAMVENPRTEALEAHGFADHYELHVWLYRENPAGMFVPFNPEIACPEEMPPLPGSTD